MIKEGQIRFFAHAWIGHKFTIDDYMLQKVELKSREYDKDNDSWYWKCWVLEDYLDESNNNRSLIVDNEWQLFETIEDAKEVLIVATLRNDNDYFFRDR